MALSRAAGVIERVLLTRQCLLDWNGKKEKKGERFVFLPPAPPPPPSSFSLLRSIHCIAPRSCLAHNQGLFVHAGRVGALDGGDARVGQQMRGRDECGVVDLHADSPPRPPPALHDLTVQV